VKKRIAVAEGVVYRRIVDTAGPWIIHVVRVEPGVAATVDTVLAGPVSGPLAYTSAMGRDAGALVAINGDFGGRDGIPSHPWAGDGTLQLTGLKHGAYYGWSDDGTTGRIGKTVGIYARDRTRTLPLMRIARWNADPPIADQIVGYTPYGGKKVYPPPNSCNARLLPNGENTWIHGSGVFRDWVVDRRWCGSGSMKVVAGSVVLSSRRSGNGADWMRAVQIGDVLRVRWTRGTPDALDIVGGEPALVQAGAIVAVECSEYLCYRHPRTGIGSTADGATLLVVVDGRKATSVGMTLVGFARYMRRLGAVEALNLDGGGSSVMWMKGYGIMNEPSDGNAVERPVTNAVLVLPGPDPAETLLRATALTRRR
jgi:hypothetical protein